MAKLFCDCGCRREEHISKLREIVVDEAIDESLRQVRATKRFLVTADCERPFIEELQAMRLLNGIVRRYMAAPWYTRIGKMRRVLRLQHVIYVRNKGIEVAKRKAIRSAIMFAAPQKVAGWLDLYWRWRDGRRVVSGQRKIG